MIYAGSRYVGATIASVRSDRGWSPTVLRTMPEPTYLYAETVIREGQNLEQIADRMYGDAEQWWRIADANPQILYPDNIPAGTVVRVPSAVALR